MKKTKKKHDYLVTITIENAVIRGFGLEDAKKNFIKLYGGFPVSTIFKPKLEIYKHFRLDLATSTIYKINRQLEKEELEKGELL